MIRIGSLSEKHDRRAQKEGFANKECDSDADEEFFNDGEQNSTFMIPP